MKQLIILIVVILGLTFGLLSLIWKDRCSEAKISESESPNGAYHIVTTVTDCGPNIPVATTIHVVDPDSGNKSDVLLYQGRGAVKVDWTGDHALSLSVPEDTVVVKRRPKFDRLKMTFKTF